MSDLMSDPEDSLGCTAQPLWRLSWRDDPAARAIADRHYNRQKVGASGFVPPGKCLVLLADTPALWVTSWPLAEYVGHAWPGAWVNSCFRKEGPGLASEMIRDAVAATRWANAVRWRLPEPELGMITMARTRLSTSASRATATRRPGLSTSATRKRHACGSGNCSRTGCLNRGSRYRKKGR